MEKRTVKEILHQQLALLAEFSQCEGNDAWDLAELTRAMAQVGNSIHRITLDERPWLDVSVADTLLSQVEKITNEIKYIEGIEKVEIPYEDEALALLHCDNYTSFLAYTQRSVSSLMLLPFPTSMCTVKDAKTMIGYITTRDKNNRLYPIPSKCIDRVVRFLYQQMEGTGDN